LKLKQTDFENEQLDQFDTAVEDAWSFAIMPSL
jgi:hypothetical protein